MERDLPITGRAISIPRSALIIWAGALLTVAVHVSLSGLYGYQRDELYFLACAKHLAWGYVDQPPLIGLVVDVSTRLFGDALIALRVLPALAAGGLVALTAHWTRRLGGGTFAVCLAMVTVALSPFDLAVGSLLTMNAFEPLLWFGLTALVYEQIEEPRAWRWTAIGAIVGLGFLNKWSMAVYAFALLTGVLLSPARRTFLTRSLAWSIAVALLIATPNLVWQAEHGWAQLQVLRNADLAKNEHISPLLFVLEQLPLMNPLAAPLWLAGLAFFGRSGRFAGIAIGYGVLVAIELVLHGKVYYVAPVYPMLIAAGAASFERTTYRRAPYRIALATAIAAAGVAIAPLATPALPLPALLAYQRALDVRSVKMENHPMGLVPQQFADQLGWDELESAVARAAGRLTVDERASAAILTGDYGQAAALDFLGRRDALPPAISGHNQYYLWGPRGEHQVVIAVGVARSALAREYRSVDEVGTYRSAFVLPQNNNLPIYLCRHPRTPLERFWPQLRRYV